MRYAVHNIHEAPRTISFDEKSPWMEAILDRLGETPASREIHVDLELSRIDDNVFVHGRGHTAVTCECARCLKPLQVDVNPEFDITLTPADPEVDESAGELQLDDEDLDYYTYDGDEVDLGELVNEQFVLAVPYRILCKEDCAGLCPRCGANRNENMCACKVEVAHTAFAALEELKAGMKKS